jgi:hypothetical protein
MSFSLRRARVLVVVLAGISMIAACSSSNAPPNDGGGDASLDGTTDGPYIDGGDLSCTVQTCTRTVTMEPGGSVPKGDSCGTACTCQCSNGSCTGGCPSVNGCTCPDGG